MNLRTQGLTTEMSQCSSTSTSQLYQKVYILQTQNLEFKRRWQACNMLNLTLKQALINISKNSRIDPQLMQKLKQLSSESTKPSSPQTLGQLRQFYQQQIRIREYKNNKVIEQLKNQHKEQLKMTRQRLQRDYKERLSKDRQHMLKQVQSYMQTKNIKQEPRKEHKQSNKSINTKYLKDSSNILKRKKSFSDYINKSALSNSFSNIERSSQRSNSKNKQDYEDSKYTVRTKVATGLRCSNCSRIFSPNQFMSHINICKSHVEYHSQRSSENKKAQLLNVLLKRKKEIQNQLSQFGLYNQQQPRQVLQTQLDQIVYVINNKHKVSNQNMEKVLKKVVKIIK